MLSVLNAFNTYKTTREDDLFNNNADNSNGLFFVIQSLLGAVVYVRKQCALYNVFYSS